MLSNRYDKWKERREEAMSQKHSDFKEHIYGRFVF
jgi:hypothetical protein